MKQVKTKLKKHTLTQLYDGNIHRVKLHHQVLSVLELGRTHLNLNS